MTITEHAQKVLAEIDAALALCEQATPGPWECVDDANNHWGMVEVKGPRVRVMGFTQATDVSFEQGIVTRADRDFIAASRTLLPSSLRCLKTSIEWALTMSANGQVGEGLLTTLCEQWDDA